MLKEKTCQSTITNLVKLSFENEGEIKAFPDKQKASVSITSRHTLQETQGESFRLKIRECDSNSKSYEVRNNTSEGNNIGKHRSHHYCIFRL